MTRFGFRRIALGLTTKTKINIQEEKLHAKRLFFFLVNCCLLTGPILHNFDEKSRKKRLLPEILRLCRKRNLFETSNNKYNTNNLIEMKTEIDLYWQKLKLSL